MDYMKQFACIACILAVYCTASPTTSETTTSRTTTVKLSTNTSITYPIVSNNTDVDSNETEEAPEIVKQEVDFFVLNFHNIFGRDVQSSEEDENRSDEEATNLFNKHHLILPAPIPSNNIHNGKNIQRDTANVLKSISSDKDTRSEDPSFPKYVNKREAQSFPFDYFRFFSGQNDEDETISTVRSSTIQPKSSSGTTPQTNIAVEKKTKIIEESSSSSSTVLSAATSTEPSAATSTVSSAATTTVPSAATTTVPSAATSTVSSAATSTVSSAATSTVSSAATTTVPSPATSTAPTVAVSPLISEGSSSTTLTISSTTEVTTPTQKFHLLGILPEPHHH